MFSNKFYRVLTQAIKLLQTIGAIPFSFNAKTRQFHRDSKAMKRAIKNYILHLIGILTLIINLVNFSSQRHGDEFNLTVVYILGAIVALLSLSMTTIFTQDSCIAFNGFINFMEYLHRKL